MLANAGEYKGKIETFNAEPEIDVYNSTPPFSYNGRNIIAARTEHQENEYESTVRFFSQSVDTSWNFVDDLPQFRMQDPFITRVGNDFILGGVELTMDYPAAVLLDYTTVIYIGESLENMRLLYKGPEKMKGIRLVELENGEIFVLTRPQVVSEKDPYGRGRIAFSLIPSLADLAEGVQNAEIIEGLFADEEWGGANEAYELENGNIGILGHHAYFDECGNKVYFVMAFEFDPYNKKIIEYKVVAKRDSFPITVRAKKADLYNVLYTGGLRKIPNSEKYQLFVGISDTAVGSIEIDSPFSSPPKLRLNVL